MEAKHMFPPTYVPGQFVRTRFIEGIDAILSETHNGFMHLIPINDWQFKLPHTNAGAMRIPGGLNLIIVSAIPIRNWLGDNDYAYGIIYNGSVVYVTSKALESEPK